MLAETVILGIAKFLGGQLLKCGYRKATDNMNDEYTQELYEVIQSTIREYEKKYPITETDHIPFYASELLLQEFLQYRLHHEFDQEKVRNAIKTDLRIIPPTPQQLNEFYNLFTTSVAASDKLKDLDVSVNYKEEVFNISSFLLSFRNEINDSLEGIKNEITSSKVSAQLIDEWNRQLEEIVDNLKAFKAYTALERLEALEKAIVDQHVNKDILFSKLYSLQADALGLLYGIDGSQEKDRQAKLMIRIHKLAPLNLIAKSNAALAYMTLGENKLACKLADEILCEDEFNLGAWLTKCFIAGVLFRDVLDKVPISLKKTDGFKLNLYRWLASNQHIKNYLDLEQFGLTLPVSMPELVNVTYKNLHYEQLVARYLINAYSTEHTTILSVLEFPDAKGNAMFEYAYKVLEACVYKLKNSEVNQYYLFYEFYYHVLRYGLYHEAEDILEMERIFNQMTEDKQEPEVVARMMQAYNSLGKKEDHDKSFTLAEEFEKAFGQAEFINVLKAGTAVLTGDVKLQAKYFIEYLKFYQTIDELAFQNFISFLRNTASRIDQQSRNEILAVVENASFTRPILKTIMVLFCAIVLKTRGYSQEQIKQMVDQARVEVDIHDESLCVHVAFAYVLTQRVQEARDFIESYLNPDVFSESYTLYCKVLHELQDSDKSELLQLLKKHREQFRIEYDLLRIEFWLSQLQGKVKDCVKLAKIGVELFPRSEFFIQWLFISLNKDTQFDEIKKYAPLAAKFQFCDEQVIVSIAQVMIQAAVFPEAVDFLFKYGINTENTQVRQAYFILSHTYPKDSMKEFEEIAVGTFVKYEINKQTKIIEITEENKDKHPYRLFVGKKTGETFSYTRSFDAAFDMCKVLRVMDKYLALFEQVMQDSDDPLSDMAMKKIDIKGDTAEDIAKSFIDAFGVTGSLQQERTEKEYEKYFNGNISFGEIANSVFRQDLVDAYFILSNQKGKPFRAIPQIYGAPHFKENTRFIVDVTALCLFYLLEKESGFVFTRKFIISSFLHQHVLQELERTKRETFDTTVSVTMDRVIPHKYDDQFKNRRVDTFVGILKWIDDHCEIADIPERLNLVSALGTDKQQDVYLNICLDNRLLLQRDNHILLTNDFFYTKYFDTTFQLAMNPVCYLSYGHNEKQKEYIQHLLERNYVGININASILNDEFFKMLSGQDNRFLICLENIKFAWNPNLQHIAEVVSFIKSVFIHSVLNQSTRDQWIFAVLQSLTNGMGDRPKRGLQIMIQREFRLLGMHAFRVTEILNQVLAR